MDSSGCSAGPQWDLQRLKPGATRWPLRPSWFWSPD